MRSRRPRIGRGAVLAIGAVSVSAAVAACSSSDDAPNEFVEYGAAVGMFDASTAPDAGGDAAPPMGIAAYGTIVGVPLDGGEDDGSDDGGDGGGDASHEDASSDAGDGGDAGDADGAT